MKRILPILQRYYLVPIFLFFLLMGYSTYFSSCTQKKAVKEEMTPERRKAIQDSIMKAKKFEIAKYWSTGYEYYKNKNYQDAKKYFLRVLKLDPEMKLADELHYKDIHGRLARCYIKENKPDSTEWAYLQGVEHFPDNSYYQESLGYIYRTKHSYEKAIHHYKKSTELEPEKASLYKILGDLYCQTREREKAIEAYETYLKLNPSDREVQDQMVMLYEVTGQAGAARQKKLELLEENPKDTRLLFELGQDYYRSFENKEALGMFKRLVKLESKNVDAWQYLAGAQMNLERYSEAISSYKKIIDLQPDNIDIMCSIADAYRMQNKFVTARNWIYKARRVDPKSGLPYITLGNIYSSAVEYCANKRGADGFNFDDKLVYELAYQQYQKASNDPVYASKAENKMRSLDPYLPTTEDRFMHTDQKKAKSDCYQWIY